MKGLRALFLSAGLGFAVLFFSIAEVFCYENDIDFLKAFPEDAAFAMEYNRAGVDALGIKSSTDMPLTLPLITNLLAAPTSASEVLSEKIIPAKGLSLPSDILSNFCSFLSSDASRAALNTADIIHRNIEFDENLPEELVKIISDIVLAIETSEIYLSKSIDSIPPDKKEDIKNILSDKILPYVQHNIPQNRLVKDGIPVPYSVWESELFKSMRGFDMHSLLYACGSLSETCDAVIPYLNKFKTEVNLTKKLRSKCGRVLIACALDDDYSKEEIENVKLLIDFGGDNRYFCPVGSASEKQVRVAIDLGHNIHIETEEPAAGAGIMGIGILYLPEEGGTKTIRCGDFSAGSGLLGAGVCFVPSKVDVSGKSFCQGAGSFGAGIFVNSYGSGSSYKADFFAQGAGMTSGLGIFKVNGEEVSVEGGLTVHDAREGLAFTSLCQGVGYGPRAVAGGGIGIAILDVSSSQVKSSYFAQGSGYWHGLGIFYNSGNGNYLQTRRYSQGAGIHTGIGVSYVSGNDNTTANWGVGPAYGWDAGTGIFFGYGDRNIYRAEWGCVHGEINGRGIFSVSGNDLKLSLPDLASGTFRRNFPSYGIAIVKGKNIIARADIDRFVFGFPGIAGNNALSVSKIDPWGVLVSDKIKFVEKIEFPEPEWKQKQGVPPASQPRDWDGTLLRKYENWLKDGNLRELLSIEDYNIETLFSLYQPWNVEELMVMISVISSYGGKIMPLLENKLKNSSISEKAVMISHLSYLSAGQSLPVIRHLLEDNDPRIKISALRALGGIYSNDEGLDPGRTFLIQSFMKFIDSGENIIEGTELEKQWINYFSQTYLSDVFSFLSMSDDFETLRKLEFYNIMPDVFSPINNNLKRYFLNYMLKKKGIYYGIFSNELNVIKSNKKYFERKVRMMMKDAHPGVRLQAITCLGEMRSKKAISSIAKFLNDERYQIREAAINSIAKFGKESMPVLKKKFRTADSRTRALISSAVFHSWEVSTLGLIDLGLNDGSDFVNMTAISAARSIKPPLSAEKDAYMENIRKKFPHGVDTE